MANIQLIIHGGVTADLSHDYSSALGTLEEIVQTGQAMLRNGAAALDVVEEVVRLMEVSGEYLAGKGSIPNAEGAFELDASIMDGANGKGAGVAAVRNARTAVALARRVMHETPHTLIVGDGVRSFFGDSETLFADAPEAYYKPIFDPKHIAGSPHGFGTVGAAAIDEAGRAAAATATCGVFKKLPGRVGDTPVLGAGTWADDEIAVSCTGQGEYFLRCNAAHLVAARLKYGGASALDAANAAIGNVTALGGLGGLIAATRDGVVSSFNTPGMKRAWVSGDGQAHVALG